MSLNSAKSLPKAPEKGLPIAAVEFAKKMGIDITGMEAEAQDMWRMLDDIQLAILNLYKITWIKII